MKIQKVSNPPVAARTAENRYLHIAGAFAAGGTFTHVSPFGAIPIPIPTVTSIELPMVGGLSAASDSRASLNCSKVKFGPMSRSALASLRQKELFAIGSAKTSCRSLTGTPDGVHHSNVDLAIRAINSIGGFSLKSAQLNLQSDHPVDQRYPNIRIGLAEISGLRVGRMNVTVELDLQSFNSFPTLDVLEPALLQGDKRISPQVANSFLRNADGSLHRNAAGYVVGSLVKSISGIPAEWIDEDGYTINWPGFGKVILGEILIGAYVRRVTLVRLKKSRETKHPETDSIRKSSTVRSSSTTMKFGDDDGSDDFESEIEVGGGCDGGSTYP